MKATSTVFHCCSNFEKQTGPPSPSVYQTPSSSNQAAVDVEAGMALHMTSKQWFDLGNPADVDHIGVCQMDVDHALPRDHVPAGSANEWFNMEL